MVFHVGVKHIVPIGVLIPVDVPRVDTLHAVGIGERVAGVGGSAVLDDVPVGPAPLVVGVRVILFFYHL